MDRYEYNVRLEQIRSLSENQEFHEAMVIADSIDWRKVRSVRTLSFISEIYKINRRYEEARDILLIADTRCPNARSVVYALCELSIRMGDLNDSVGYLREYMELAPQDPSTYVLQYKFYELTNVGIRQKIEILEQLKNIDYQERWGYELAKLYAEAGEKKKCVEECDSLELWFGHGKFVTKALELKMRFEQLTPEQQHKYDHKDAIEVLASAENLMEPDDEEEERGPLSIEISNIQPSNQPTNRIPDKEIKDKIGVEDIKAPSVNLDKYSTMNLQAELRKNMTELENKTGELLREREVPLPPMRDIVPMKADTDVSEITAGTGPDNRISEAPVMPESVAPVSPMMPEPRINAGDDDVFSNRVPLNIGSKRESDVEREFARILSEDYDGQLSLNLPEGPGAEDRQITGQINIDDILNGWGRGKPKNKMSIPSTPAEMSAASEMPAPAPAVKPAPAVAPVPAPAPTPVPVVPPVAAAPVTPAPAVAPAPAANPAPAPMPKPETSRIKVEQPDNLPEEPVLPEEEPESVKGRMKRETLAVTSDLTGLLREHRERMKKERTEAEPEPEKEELPVEEEEDLRREEPEDIPEEETGDYPEEEPDHIPEDEEPEDEEPEDEIEEPKKYVAPKAQEVHGFDDEEKEIFAQFLPMHDLPDLIRNTLDRMKLNGKNGNVFITGNEQSARISLANALAKGYMHEHPDEFVGKVAKISADLFNTKNVKDVLTALDGCALVIERAADLTDASLEDIRTVLTKPDTSIILILEETKASYKMLERNHKKDWFDDVFDVKIEIPTYTNDDLVFHGREYAREQEYIIDDMGVLALYTRIDERQTADHFVTIDEVEEIVDAAIKHANRLSAGHLLDVVFGKRYDDDDMIILREKDFVQ